ncbi:MAG: LEA type 2 family protein [Gammaproteobacteria bacterium]
MPALPRFLFALALFAIAGCARVPERIDPPSVALSDLRLVDMTLIEQTFAVKLRVRNPNPFDVPVRALDCAVEINGTQVATGASERPVTLPALGETFADVRAVTSLGAVLQQLGAMSRGGTRALRYRVHGTLRVGRGLDGLVPIPFEQRGDIDLDALLKPPAPPAPMPGA